jgi:hypothetical protein
MRTAVLILLTAASAFAQPAAKSAPCDRACLESYVDQYMDALVAHSPQRIALASHLKNTENGQRLDPGDGFWRTATAKGAYRLFVDDPEAGQVAFLGTMKEANIPVTVAIRLKIDNRQISEIELFVVRTGLNSGNGAPELDKLGAPNPLFLTTIPAPDRATRADLIKTANMYFTGLEKNDGKGNYPFTDDCERLEDGQQSTHNTAPAAVSAAARGGRGKQVEPPPPPPTPAGFNPAALGCKEQFQSGYFHFVTRIRDRRFVAVDPERGLVFSFVFFDAASGKYRNYKMSDGRDASNGPTRPASFEIAEMFRIEKGKIRRVEAVLEQVPYGMLSGWDGISSKPR